jgi:hypothetical protein
VGPAAAKYLKVLCTTFSIGWMCQTRGNTASAAGPNTGIAMMQRLGICRETSEQQAGQPDRPFVTGASGHSHTSHGIQGEDCVYGQSIPA